MLKAIHTVHITPQKVEVDGHILQTENSGSALLTELYRTYVKDYPKFFKMDGLSKLGFIASELLQMQLPERMYDCENCAVVFFNRSASLCNDAKYQETISGQNYFPSPALFVYTLPNIVTGEIAIRNKFYGENSFYVVHDKEFGMIEQMLQCCIQDPSTDTVIGGWLECSDPDTFEAEIKIYRI